MRIIMEMVPVVSHHQDNEEALSFVVGDANCDIDVILTAINPDYCIDFEGLHKKFRKIARTLGVSRSKVFYLWSRYHVLSWVSLYDIYYDALEAWRQVRSNDATLRNLLYVLEIEELHYSADKVRVTFKLKTHHNDEYEMDPEVPTSPGNGPFPGRNTENRDHHLKSYTTIWTVVVLVLLVIIGYFAWNQWLHKWTSYSSCTEVVEEKYTHTK